MIIHPPLSVLFVTGQPDSKLEGFLSYLESISHVKLTIDVQLPQDLSPHNIVVTANAPTFASNDDSLTQFVQAGGGWLELVHLSEKPLHKVFGAELGPLGPENEIRVLFHDKDHPAATRLPDAIYLGGRYHPLVLASEDTELILYADWHYQHSPVLISRKVGRGRVACTTLQAYDNPTLQQILYRVLLHLTGRLSSDQTLGVGLLGYSPFVGKEHGLGVNASEGLNLRAICDINPERLKQAQQDFPALSTYDSAKALTSSPDIDVVIISTPPNTHAGLSLDMMAAGKHVLCEKPLALNQEETAALVEMAEKQRVHLSCHQNRRWDSDYLAIKQALAEGLIGALFYLETFVGGFSHPCGYWHSHDTISGGVAYDWGGHYLDWILSLMPYPVKSVIGTRHKRVWHDVTNADQERIQISFAGGQEAEFLHSDIAGVRKPKWYLLGTKGAIIGHWRDVTEYEIDPVLYFHEHEIPATEMTPELILHRRHATGQIVAQKLAVPERQHHVLYKNLADHLLTGEPIVASLEQSVLVVAILEAAARSAAKGGTVEGLNG